MILYSTRMKCVSHEAGETSFQDACVWPASHCPQSLLVQALQRSCLYSPTSSNSHSVLKPYYFGLSLLQLMKGILLRSSRTSVANPSGNFYSSLKLDPLAVMDTWPFSPWSTFFRVLLRQKILLCFCLSLHSLLLLKVNSPEHNVFSF